MACYYRHKENIKNVEILSFFLFRVLHFNLPVNGFYRKFILEYLMNVIGQSMPKISSLILFQLQTAQLKNKDCKSLSKDHPQKRCLYCIIGCRITICNPFLVVALNFWIIKIMYGIIDRPENTEWAYHSSEYAYSFFTDYPIHYFYNSKTRCDRRIICLKRKTPFWGMIFCKVLSKYLFSKL